MDHLLNHTPLNSTPIRTPPGKAECLTSTKGIKFWKGTSFWNHGIPMGRLQRLNACTSILVDRSIFPQITSNNIFLEGRVQFITLQLLNNGNMTIVNIYIARTSNTRVLMWKWLSEARFDTPHVIIGSDFNHLEEMDKRRKVGERLMLRREVAA
jgi:hypothetical protein